jgi:hypothetical protein
MSGADVDSFLNARELQPGETALDDTYRHKLQAGFPSSMLDLKAGSGKLIAMLRTRGLTTAVMKEVLARPWVRQVLKKANGSREDAITKLLSNPYFRADIFVKTAERQSVRRCYYALSLELTIMTAFEPDWPSLALDEVALQARCGPWKAIRQGLSENAFKDAKPSTLGVFMIWLKVRAALESWATLDADARESAVYAAFALSSLGTVDWFIRTAIEIVPELEEELGHLRAADPEVKSEADTSPTTDLSEPRTAGAIGSTRSTDVASAWASIGEELVRLHDEWGETPRRGQLQRLMALGVRAAEMEGTVPEDKKPAQAVLQESLVTLRLCLLDMAVEVVMSWLGPDVIAQVMARWDLKRAKEQDEQALLELAEDAGLALSRIAAAFAEMQAAEARVTETKEASEVLESELATCSSAIRQLELEERSFQAREDSIDAERKRKDVRLFVLASASPHGGVFDLAVDYAAQADQQSTAESSSEDDSGTPVIESGTRAVEVPAAPETPVQSTKTPLLDDAGAAPAKAPESPSAVVGTLVREPVAALPMLVPKPAVEGPRAIAAVKLHEPPASPALPAPVGGGAVLTPSEQAEDLPDIQPDQEFSDAAGDRCRPIWSLLQQGKPALAFQFATALQAVAPNIRVPHPSLLRSVALAPGLTASDGPLAEAIGESFADIQAIWFEPGEAPSNWCTALNLLLIAATLRPMVLAPLTSASAIAGYRHLDGRHSAVLQLVKSVVGISERLTRFAIGPSVLRSAADESSLRSQVAQLSKAASDWLHERAPNKKIRYAPASKVWLHWLRPGEPIHALIATVTSGSTAERGAVRAAIDQLSDYDKFNAILAETDRRKLDRRGPDIEAGALEHLWIATCEAVDIAKAWLATVEMLTESGDQLRALVGQLQLAFQVHADGACLELEQPWAGDEWGQVRAASRLLFTEVKAVADMFRASDAIPVAEPMSKEILARDLLWVPGAFVGEGWAVESDSAALLQALTAWSKSPVGTEEALTVRLASGDVAGAELLLAHVSDDRVRAVQAQEVERAREQWLKDLQRQVLQARRATEVGLAYGYLTDAERAACESELSALEVGLRDSGRFDEGMRKVAAVQTKVEGCKAQRVEKARASFERERPRLSEGVAGQVEAPLARSDIHTFNELLQRARQGADPWPDRDHHRDAFKEFYPKLQHELNEQLGKLPQSDVEKLIRTGGAIGSVSFHLDGDDLARQYAESTYRTWATSASRRNMADESLRRILESVGVTVSSLRHEKPNAHQLPSWTLQAAPLDDREICPVPHFGSRAQGRYRVLCIFDRLTPEDFLQRTGEETQQTATIVVALGRSPQRLWAELARASKERQRSFLLLDESMLLFLLAQQGSRLATWFSIALPFTHSEPYDASAGYVPAEMFYGRASELESVRMQGGCYFIYGGRQLGKTALLRRAEKTFHDPAAERYAIWIDLLAQGIGERRRVSEVWLSVFEKLRDLKIAGLEMPSVNPAKPASVDAFLGAIKSFLFAKPGRRILLLLDEADRFFEQDGRQESGYAETRRLKQLMDETERRFKVVFAGLHNVLRTVSTSNQPLGHFNEAVRIGPLMDEREIRAAEELITRPIEAAGFEFEDRSLVMRVLAQTNYYPSLIQLYCTQLLRHLRETRLRRRDAAGPRFKIEEADIESVFSGRPLRDAIRAKFRLTLQLDDRYEVIANAIGLEALSAGFDHAEGIEWRKIRNDCATLWWPEGFASTSERDFLALLEEMVQLGVLSQASVPDHFSLRNPNVLLLLGSKQEIENTLQAEREPRIEFESTIFRPALAGSMDQPARNPLTYRQLDEVMQLRSSVLLVAATDAAGGKHLLSGLRDQPGMTDARSFVLLGRATDPKTFTLELDKEVKKRDSEGIMVMMVPAQVPWDANWVAAARTKLNALTSKTSFVSVVFAADPERLWALTAAAADRQQWIEPWLSVLPWTRGFVRKWLEELQLTADAAVDRLEPLTGYWGGLLETAASVTGGALDFAHNLERMTRSMQDAEWRQQNRSRLTGGIEAAESVLRAMCSLGDGVTEEDLVEFGDLPQELVERTLRWAEPLGLVVRQPGSFWALDAFAKRMLEDPAP